MKSNLKFISLVVLMSGMLSVKAQSVEFGIKGGLNYSIFTHTDPNLTGFGFHFGGLADLSFSRAFNLRAELLISNRAIQSKSSYNFLGIETTLKSRTFPLYLTLPLLYRYETNEGISFFAGPQPGLLLSNRITSKTQIGNEDPVSTTFSGSDAKSGLSEFVLGVAAGVYYTPFDDLGLDLRYVRDFVPTSDLDGVDNFYNGIQLSIIYRFSGGQR